LGQDAVNKVLTSLASRSVRKLRRNVVGLQKEFTASVASAGGEVPPV